MAKVVFGSLSDAKEHVFHYSTYYHQNLQDELEYMMNRHPEVPFDIATSETIADQWGGRSYTWKWYEVTL